jgi:hypothetical protein
MPTILDYALVKVRTTDSEVHRWSPVCVKKKIKTKLCPLAGLNNRPHHYE